MGHQIKPDVDVCVIGGGPAGSTAATLLARHGLKVVVLEKEKFPRYHIGESTLPGAMPVLREMGVYEKVLQHGFIRKPGVTWIWGKNRKSWPIFFDELGGDAFAFQVVRSEFDHILLQHAAECGAEVREQHLAQEPLYNEEGRCIGVSYTDPNGKTGQIYSRYVVVASGQNLFRIEKENERVYDDKLNNVAIWAYWKGCKPLDGRERGNILSATAPIGWVWYIPLNDGTTSVGIVVHKESVRKAGGGKENMLKLYREGLAATDHLPEMMVGAEQVSDIKTQRDWSYITRSFSGPGYLLTGDAAGFVDPLLSTGVYLAVTGGRLAANVINMCLKHESDPHIEKRALSFYESTYKKILEDITAFVRYMYDAEAVQDSYFWQAQKRVGAFKELTAREAFIYLISGEAGREYVKSYEDKFFLSMFQNLENLAEHAKP